MDAGEAGGLAQGPFIPDDASCSGTPDKVLSQKSRTPTVPTAARRKITAFAPLNLELLAQAGSFKKRRSSGKKNGEEEEKGEEGKTKTKRAPILDKESPPRRRRRIDLDELAEAEQAMTAADLLSTGWRNAVVSTNRRDRSLDCDLLDENEEDGLTWRRMASICKRQSDDIRQPKTSWASEASKQEAAFELQPTWKQKRIGALVSRMLFRQKDLAPASDNLVDQLRLVLKRRVDKEVADSVHSTLQHQIEAHRPLVDVPRRGGTKVVRRLHELIETKHPWLGELLRLRESVAAEQGTQRKERVKAEAADTKQSPSVLGGHIMRVVSAIDEPSSSTSYQGGSIRVYDGTTNPEHWDRPQSMAEGKLAARISRLRRQEILRSMGFNLQVVHVDAEKKLPGVIVVEDDAKVADLEQSHMVPAATSGDSKRIPLSARHPKIVAGLLADLQDDEKQSISERARSRLFAARLRAEARCWVFQRARTAVDRKRHRRLRMVSTQANWRHLQTASKFASIRSPSEREIWRVVKFAHGSLRRALQIARTSASGLDVAPVTRRETSDSGELTFVDTSKNQDISLPVVLRSVVRRGDVLQSPSGRTAEERLARDEALQDRLVVEEVLDSVVSFVAAQVDRQFEPLDLANRSRIRSNTRQPQLSSSADDHRPSTSKTAENDEEAISARRADLVAKIKRRVQISRALMDAVAEHGAEKHPDDDPGTDREGISISKSDVSAMRERFSGIFGKKLAARRRRRRRRSDGSDSGAASTSEDEDDKEGGRNVVDAGPAVESPNFRAAVSSRILLQRRLERLDRLVADQLAWEQRLLCAWIDYLRAAEPHTYWALVKDVQRDVDSAERDETIVARRYARFVEVLLRVPVDRAVQKRAQFGEVTESVDLLPSAWQINQALGPLSPYWRGAAPCPLDESEPSFVDRRGQLSFERPDDWKPAPNPFRQLYIEDLAECRYISASDLSRAIERADGSVEKLERIVGGDVGQPRNGEEHSSRGTARLHDVLATLAFDEIPLDNVEKSATEEEEEGDGGGGLQSIAMRPTKLQRPPDPPGRIPPDVQAQRDRLREQFATAVQVARQASQFTSQLRDAVRALVDRHFRERRLHRRWVDENIADRDEDDAKNRKKATARSVKQPEKVETARELAERLAREVEDEDSDDEEGSGVGPQEPSVPIEYDDSRRVQLLLTVDWLKRLARLEGVPREREDASPPPPARLVSFHELVQRHREARESDPNYQNRYQNHHRQQSSPVVLNSSDERSSRASKPRPRGGPNNSHSRRRMPQSTSSNSVADTFKRLLTAPP